MIESNTDYSFHPTPRGGGFSGMKPYKELAEISVLQRYLPIEWSDAELEQNVQLAIDNLGASSKKDMGRVIKAVVEAANGQCDNKRISQAVGAKLN